MSRTRRRTFPTLLALLAALVCLICAAGAAGTLWLSGQARDVFGPPAPGLGFTDRVTYAARLLLAQDALRFPSDRNGAERSFRVDLGESIGSIAYRLEVDGLVPDAGAFRSYLIYKGYDTSVQAGRYRLSPAMSPMEIAEALRDATPMEVDFTILEGWRAEEIAAALRTSGLQIQPDAFLEAIRAVPPGYSFSQRVPQGYGTEGFLFPGSYVFARDVPLDEFLTTFYQRFDQSVGQEMQTAFAQNGLNLYEAVTLASVVEREAVDAVEMPRIASVFYNRLAAGMSLDSDPTVQYAVGYNAAQNTWWTNPLSRADLQTDSPYNTYLYTGLPPGPIANPGLAALTAVANPEQTPYYYFRAACDGSGRHVFAETYEQHLNNDCGPTP